MCNGQETKRRFLGEPGRFIGAETQKDLVTQHSDGQGSKPGLLVPSFAGTSAVPGGGAARRQGQRVAPVGGSAGWSIVLIRPGVGLGPWSGHVQRPLVNA